LRQALEGNGNESRAAEHSPAPRFQPPTPGELARYFPQVQVLELLGQGGMGAVYKARQTKLDRLVAIKILPPEVARDPAFAERFVREARSLARLNHPHIVTVHDFGDVDGLFHFTMEYVDGRNLRTLLQDGPLPAAQAKAILTQVCDALQYAHDEGLVHRDIKPENILIDKKGRVKIADFGLARLVGLTPTYLTLTGTHEVMGTLLYMAPEQMKQAHSVDHRADLYSLGVVLYEMLTGELPLGRFAPPSRKAAVNERVDQVVLRALAREPADRYQDAAAFRQELEAALAEVHAAPGPRIGPHGKPIWPSVRFEAYTSNDLAALGLLSRDETDLIMEFEGASRKLWRKLKAFFSEPDVPREVRIPLHEISWISYGWGWGQVPRSVIVRVSRLAALAGVPGNDRGQITLCIAREDRTAARRLVESIAPATALGHVRSDDPREAHRATAGPALGLFTTALLALVSAAPFVVFLPDRFNRRWEPWEFQLALTPLLALSGILLAGALALRRRRWYPVAATAAIVAMVPWSPAWFLGLPVGIWTCIALGEPAVTAAFFGQRQLDAAPVAPPSPHHNRLLSLLRSVGGYILPTTVWRRGETSDVRDRG
jgi:serine/threonine protein kinase